MFKNSLENIQILLKLGRYNYPTGAFLLLWPCIWGMSYQINSETNLLKIFILFVVGSFVMRGAGCCINDFFDKDLDRLVSRTKKRPLASKEISIKTAFFFTCFQLLIGLFVVIQFNLKAILFSFFIIPLVIVYPLLKRITFFPQIILGIVFNWGIVIGFLTQNTMLNSGIFFLYLGGVFYTVGYDTIYGFQDMKDDKKIGVKSLSIKIENKSDQIIPLIFSLSLICISIAFFLNENGNVISKLISIFFIILFFSLQVYAFKKRVPYKKIFDSSVFTGSILSLLIFTQNYL
tara:strand:+ start:542 stop:1411 length:870 start_codon:yes stop_codon:yes gene_type:complete